MRAVLCFLVLVSSALAGPSPEDVVGYWEGAFVRQGTPMRINVTIEETPDGLEAKLEVPEWIWYDVPPDPVRLTETGIVIEDLYGADGVLTFDPRYRQMVGTINAGDQVIQVHLKPMPTPPKPAFSVEVTTFTSGDGTVLSGTFVMPDGAERAAGIVLLHGRGCGTRSEGEARALARYGIAVLTYDKRGAGESEGECPSATHEMNTEDAIAALNHLARMPGIDREKVGLKATSAGAWTAQAVAGEALAGRNAVTPAFLITWIGPATSILQQQLSSAATVARSSNLSEDVVALAQEAVRLIVDDAVPRDEAFVRLRRIRDQAENDGWYASMFEGDDLPESEADMESLFLRRFRFDPAPILAELETVPYLAVFGENDPVVPLDENLAALAAIEEAGGDLTVVTLPGVGHSFEHGDRTVTLPNGGSYFKNDTVEPGYMIATVEFLHEKGFAVR